MTPEQAQRLVHELPGWDQSIDDARAELGYDPSWWNTEATGWDGTPPEPPLHTWFGRHRSQYRERCDRALEGLGLGELFAPYWRACFISLRDHDLSTVEEREPLLDGRNDLRRVFPPVASMLSVRVTTEASRSHLTIDGPTAFVTDATLREASARALRLVERGGGDREHRLLQMRRSRVGQIARASRANPRRERALQLRREGQTLAPIMRVLQLEFDRPPAESTVREWLAEGFDRRP